MILTALLLFACGGPGPNGWYRVPYGKVRIHAGELGDGCRLVGGEYGSVDLDPDDPWTSSPNVTLCAAYAEFQGDAPNGLIFSGPQGGLHEAYEPVDLQPLFVEVDSAYLNLQAVTVPGPFVLPLVLGDRADPDAWEEVALEVEALDPR